MLWWLIPFLGLIDSILAIVFGSLGLRSSARGMATAGLVTGIVALVLTIIGFVIWGALWGSIVY
ncbi:hypothetical protein H5T53_01750 [Candidatus Bipolaricaulota bacterium]|nr:hypothetical protein [Candidatus Bipolaricaulota bacterium]